MEIKKHQLRNGRALMVREATVEDARLILDYVESASGESDFLSFGPGEFDLNENEEADFLLKNHGSDNQIYLVGLIDNTIVSTLNFSGGRRPRLRHSGEFGLSVKKAFWGLGIGSLMLDTLIDWAKESQIITKINLRTRTDNNRAISLYERKGFTREGSISREMLLAGKYYDHLWMGLEL